MILNGKLQFYPSKQIENDDFNIHNFKMIIALFFIALSATVITLKPCEPYAVRIFYGDIVINPDSNEGLSIYFNTQQACPNSFVRMLTKDGFERYACQNQKITTSSFTNFFTTFVQRCSITDFQFDQRVGYTPYGWDSKLTNSPTNYNNMWIEINIVDPRPSDRSVSAVVLADWGKIDKNKDIIKPITQDLKRAIKQKDIDAIIIAGDIAYDLDSNNGTTYEDFLQMIEEVSTQTPFFIAPGNHERKTVDASLLLNKSFKLYEVDRKLSAGISFGSLYLTLFDPFGIVFDLPELVSSLAQLSNQISKGRQGNRFIIPVSHYPLICSGQYEQCLSGYQKMHSFFDFFVEEGVNFYIGAHTHSYERNYPYYDNHEFKPVGSPYTIGDKYLVSIVEGVAGNDRSIINKISDPKSFTAKYTQNQTGFGVLQASAQKVSYRHLSTSKGFVDDFVFLRKNKNSPQTVKFLISEQ